MTPTRYLFYRAALTFGLGRKNLRMGDAASEMHLLKEAEAYLGQVIWKNVEDIETLSMEYWNLRKLSKEREQIASELEVCEEELAQAHVDRSSLLSATNEPFQDLLDERKILLEKLEELALKRNSIVAKARDVRRNHDGIKMKQEVLTKEGEPSADAVNKMSARLNELKKTFAVLKVQRGEVGDQIAEVESQAEVIENKIAIKKKDRRGEASEAFQQIGEGNQKMSALRSEIGLLDTRMHQLYSEIGRQVSRSNDPACQKAFHSQQGLVEVMRALRKSIQLNHKLAELS